MKRENKPAETVSTITLSTIEAEKVRACVELMALQFERRILMNPNDYEALQARDFYTALANKFNPDNQ